MILVIGADGFIGSHLVRRLVAQGEHEIVGVDLQRERTRTVTSPLYRFHKIDILKDILAIGGLIEAADIVIPLAAIANPRVYITDPKKVYKLDFEAQAEILKACARRKKRVIIPSTSEVYGDATGEFLEDETPSVLGPISAQRWIYATCKMMIDRLAWAMRDELDWTIFRPFNWIGPGQDSIALSYRKESRLIPQVIYDIMTTGKATIVGDGKQERCYCDVEDGIDCLMEIVRNPELTTHQIFNIGNPLNRRTVSEVVGHIVDALALCGVKTDGVVHAPGEARYGEGYQDIRCRIPSVRKAMDTLGWSPKVGFVDSINRIVDAEVMAWEDAKSA